MRDLTVTENITLDGVIDATEGWFDPAGADPEVDQSDVIETVRRHSEAADAFLVGRVTFVEMRGFWPHQTDDTTGVSDYLNRVSKYVVSGSLQDPEWENTTVLSGPPARRHRGAQVAARQGHRHDREHHAGSLPDRRRAGRRVPAVRVPGRARAGRAAVRRRFRRARAAPRGDPAVPQRDDAPPLPAGVARTPAAFLWSLLDGHLDAVGAVRPRGRRGLASRPQRTRQTDGGGGMLAQRVSRLWFVSFVAGSILLGVPGTASAAPPTCEDEPARILYELPAGVTWTHPRADCTDPDGDAIHIEISEPPEFGVFDQAIPIPINTVRKYTANADAAGNRDSMKFRAVTLANNEVSDEFQVDVWILPANSAPVCKDLALTVQAGTSVAIAPECVDADNDTYNKLRIGKDPEHGTYDPLLRTYTAAPRYAGQDSMTFTVTDHWEAPSEQRTVTITVTQAPGQPTATGDKTAPTLTLAAKSPVRTRKALRGGIKLTAMASEPGRVVVEALLTSTVAKKLGIEQRVGSIARNLEAGKNTLKLKLYRKVRDDLADLRRFRLRFVARMVDAAGNLRSKQLRVTVQRG